MTKLRWGMIGGGEGSQIGPAHRLGALADGLFEFSAAALDHRPDVGRSYAKTLGVSENRAYGDWNEMLASEAKRDDRIDLVTVATPNSTHFEITKAFLEAGFNVLCEKPMTMTVEEGEEIVKIANKVGKLCTVNYCYSAYPIVRQARAMVQNGELGKIRLIVTNFSHGHHGDADDAGGSCTAWLDRDWDNFDYYAVLVPAGKYMQFNVTWTPQTTSPTSTALRNLDVEVYKCQLQNQMCAPGTNPAYYVSQQDSNSGWSNGSSGLWVTMVAGWQSTSVLDLPTQDSRCLTTQCTSISGL